jgi:hypothetical protein
VAIIPTIVGEGYVQNPDGTSTRIAFWEISFDTGPQNNRNPAALDSMRIVVTGQGRYKARAWPLSVPIDPVTGFPVDPDDILESPVVTSTGADGTQASPWARNLRGIGARYDVNVITRAGKPVIDNYQLEFIGPIA